MDLGKKLIECLNKELISVYGGSEPTSEKALLVLEQLQSFYNVASGELIDYLIQKTES